MKIKTEVFQEAVAIAVKGASFNKIIPITGFMTIEQTKGFFELRTTDGMNKMVVKRSEKSKELLLATVKADILASLVAKTTSEFIELKVIDNYLQVKGNGNYKLDMPLDEEEQLVIINDDLIETKEKSIKINVEELKNVLKTHKASVAETMEVPCLVGYYFNEKAITTNRFLVTTTNINLFGREVLLSSSLAELLYLFKEDIKVIVTNNRAIFENENLKISGYIMDEIADYPVESIEKISASVFDYSIKIDKKSLLQAVDRLTLFVDPFDENGIYLDFETSGVSLKNKKSNGTEFVEYDKESKEEIKFRCFSDIEFLVSQLNSYPEDTVEIEFGSKVLIKFKSENVTQMLALLTPEGDDE